MTYDCRYDGNWSGLLCCLFEMYECRGPPQAAYSHEDVQQTLYPALEIVTDSDKADRARHAILPKIGFNAKELAEHAPLTCLPQKELWVPRSLRLVFQHDPTTVDKMTQPTVCTLNKAILHLQRESHQYQGFMCFSVLQGTLWSVIEPKNQMLPLLAPHLCQRFYNEAFLIYDKTHDQALVYQNGQRETLPLLTFESSEPSETELCYRKSRHIFYDSISIRDRENLHLRMTHM